MPEGPEVKKMSQDLALAITEKRLEGFEVLSGRYTKAPLKGSVEIAEELPTTILGVGCHGKFSYVLLDCGWSLWITLGMTGWWSSRETKHSRVKFELSDGDLFFNDPRNFGTLAFVKGSKSLKDKLASLGPDPLAGEVTQTQFVAALRKKNKWNVCKALMDQSVIAGVGNYIKAEALWLSRIDPRSDVIDLSDSELNILRESIRNIMLCSYENDGATFKSHKNFDGETGSFSQHFMCYGRKVDEDGNPVQRLETPDGRTTHWSPKRQARTNQKENS